MATVSVGTPKHAIASIEQSESPRAKRVKALPSILSVGPWAPTAKPVDEAATTTLDVTTPVTGEVISKVHMGGAADVDAAVSAAADAFPAWSALTQKRRAQILLKFHTLVGEHAEELVRLIMAENGKNKTEAEGDLAKGLETVEWACSIPFVAPGRTLAVSGGVTCQEVHACAAHGSLQSKWDRAGHPGLGHGKRARVRTRTPLRLRARSVAVGGRCATPSASSPRSSHSTSPSWCQCGRRPSPWVRRGGSSLRPRSRSLLHRLGASISRLRSHSPPRQLCSRALMPLDAPSAPLFSHVRRQTCEHAMPPLPLSSHTCAAKRASTRARAVAGNCVILKPSEKVPMTMRRVADLLTQAGVPSGAFQMVQGGQEVVEALCDHRGIHALTFVGSSRVAKLVHARAVGTGKKALALGGAKNHLVAASDVRAPARPGISPDPCCCRPLLLPTRAAAGPCCCRPLLLPARAAADPCCCRPLLLPAPAAADPCCCRPVLLPTPAAADP